MCFLRVRRNHHILAISEGPHVSLNHISFEMRGLDEFMRGTGRLIRSGSAPLWGPGRHGAGDNTFSYFADATGKIVSRLDVIYDTDELVENLNKLVNAK